MQTRRKKTVFRRTILATLLFLHWASSITTSIFIVTKSLLGKTIICNDNLFLANEHPRHMLTTVSQTKRAKKRTFVFLVKHQINTTLHNSVHDRKIFKPKCMANIEGRGRRRTATVALDRIIQRKIKVVRRKSAPVVKHELEKEIRLIIHANTVRNRLHEIGFHGRVARNKPYVNKPSDYWRSRLVRWIEVQSFRFRWKGHGPAITLRVKHTETSRGVLFNRAEKVVSIEQEVSATNYSLPTWQRPKANVLCRQKLVAREEDWNA